MSRPARCQQKYALPGPKPDIAASAVQAHTCVASGHPPQSVVPPLPDGTGPERAAP
ncbi:hypothetical protein ACFC09_01655 [Streptomyces sp. NPDC056161]|uniref:hypothetical protein n=1 Tax=Streptomyces sp. NPDC056161 TaxID=3345732 RepID=UPI0035D803A4